MTLQRILSLCLRRWLGAIHRLAQQLFVRTFRRLSGPRPIDAYLAVACDHRLADRNLTPGERTNVAALRKRALSGSDRTRPRS